MPPGAPSATSLKRIQREIADIKREDLGDIKLAPTEENMHIWKGSIPGPEGSVYEGGVFNVEVVLPSDYPFTAPRVVFKTKIYHMNISEQGNICIDILKSNWSPALSLFKVMLSLSSLLTDPNPKDPLVPGIATQYTRNRKLHDSTARQWTEMYAKPQTAPKPAPPPPVITTPFPSHPSVPAAAAPPARRNGRRGAEPSSSRASSSRAGSSRQAASSSSTPIVIDADSDNEARPTSSNTRGKRKRQDDASSSSSKSTTAPGASSRSGGRNAPAGVVDLAGADDEEPPATRPKRSRMRGGHSTAVSNEVIVIED